MRGCGRSILTRILKGRERERDRDRDRERERERERERVKSIHKAISKFKLKKWISVPFLAIKGRSPVTFIT
jgi:hypothetical protein